MRSVRHISCLLVLLSIVIFSCKREERAFRVQPPDAQSAQLPMATEFHAGKRRDAIMNTQSALSPAGAAAQYFDVLWWRTFWLLGAVYVIVLIFALWPAWRRRAPVNHSETVIPGLESERRLTIAVGIG